MGALNYGYFLSGLQVVASSLPQLRTSSSTATFYHKFACSVAGNLKEWFGEGLEGALESAIVETPATAMHQGHSVISVPKRFRGIWVIVKQRSLPKANEEEGFPFFAIALCLPS